MFAWIAANTANLIVGGIVFVMVVFAARHVFKKMKNGQCVGCCDCAKNGQACCRGRTIRK